MRPTFAVVLLFFSAGRVLAEPPRPTRTPLARAVDLDLGESAEVELCDGKKAGVKLLGLRETRDDIRSAVRRAQLTIEVNGQPATLTSAMYHLPVTLAGVRIDCPITKGILSNSNEDAWGLVKDARFRLWPADSPLVVPGSLVYPVEQRWFASGTQMANEPTFIDGGERPALLKIYYHYGLDIGGAEGMVEVLSATDGLVVSAGLEVLPGYKDTPVLPETDTVYVVDDQGWFYRYTHLLTMDPPVRVGRKISQGQKIGLLGKEGSSGGWSHLHFQIISRQPSGKWGTQEGYAFLWEAYQRQYQPQVVAVARRPHLSSTRQKVVLDGSRSWSRAGKIGDFQWTFSDGSSAQGAVVERTYDRPGLYSEVLKVADAEGRIDYDFAVVQVLDPAHLDRLPPGIHAAYFPTFGIKAGDPLTFMVRTFGTTHGQETWDFGDGSDPVAVTSDGNVEEHAKNGYAVTIHRYQKNGHYVVRVSRGNQHGLAATAHLHVRVGQDGGG